MNIEQIKVGRIYSGYKQHGTSVRKVLRFCYNHNNKPDDVYSLTYKYIESNHKHYINTVSTISVRYFCEWAKKDVTDEYSKKYSK